MILLSLCLGLFFNHNAIAEEQPNIILIVADDLGYSDLGIYGSEIKTPNLDLIAKRGIQLTNYHTA
ncbi:MAG: sulfatase-like hydrolase/transferase, partial [Pseudomonadota bacterium]|nr:sulfatase-like hydrolase/transferase [Pseudomonadota bacterium]